MTEQNLQNQLIRNERILRKMRQNIFKYDEMSPQKGEQGTRIIQKVKSRILPLREKETRNRINQKMMNYHM